MANRSYLYATDAIPETGSDQRPDLVGIAEFAYDIPLVFRLLLSGNPRPTRSAIWETKEEIAVSGDYSAGVDRLKRFFAELDDPRAVELIQEAIEYLDAPAHLRKHFHLECGEIFEMQDEPLSAQARQLIAEIQAVDAAATEAIQVLRQPRPEPAIKSKRNDPMLPLYAIGLGSFEECLYFDFSGPAEEPPHKVSVEPEPDLIPRPLKEEPLRQRKGNAPTSAPGFGRLYLLAALLILGGLLTLLVLSR